jgi:uncharacterized protein (TIGR02271 family)
VRPKYKSGEKILPGHRICNSPNMEQHNNLRGDDVRNSPRADDLRNNLKADEARQSYARPTEGTTVLPVIEEHLVVTKEVIETGKVLIRKRISEEEASINIPLIQEGYQVERVAGKKELLAQHPPIRYEGENMIIPVVREVLVVEKRYEVLEEVHVIKTRTEVPHLQQITLLKETVEVKRTQTNG